ncbi:hypothetical protein MNBD_GAMMA14-1044, partial [hydrothermal vent metagenome]
MNSLQFLTEYRSYIVPLLVLL